jgi:LysM repeat protein
VEPSCLARILTVWLALGSLAGFLAPESSYSAEEDARFTVVVRTGDTLGEIATKHYRRFSFWKRIAQWNGIQDPKKLQIGQELVLLKNPDTVNSLTLETDPPRTPASIEPSHAAKSFREAQDLFKVGKFKEAHAKLSNSRKRDSTYIPTWIYEIRALKELGKNDEARALAVELTRNFPALAELQFIQSVLSAE